MFPIEAGDINSENRILPHLPGEGLSHPGGLLVLAPLTCPPSCPLFPHPFLDLTSRMCSLFLWRPFMVRSAPRWFDGQRTTESRQGTLTEYCNTLMGLPVKISRCPHLLEFFKVRPDDLKLPTDNQ